MMAGDWPAADMYIDHCNRDASDNRWANLRLCTVSENNSNCDRGYLRTRAVDEVLEQGVMKRPNGSYSVRVMLVYGGTFKSLVEANQVCREMRRALKPEFDVPFRTSRRMIRGSAPDR
jgi:hypothetical protein